MDSAASLLSLTGFLGGTTDTFTIADGFISGLDALVLPTGVDVLADASGPTIVSVSLQGLADGDLISPDKPATILINLNEEVAAGTAITGQMNVTTSSVSTTPYPIVFKAEEDGTVLQGTFTPATNDNESTAIDIQDLSLKIPTGQGLTALQDIFGNATTANQLSIPTGKNISGNVGNILVDRSAPTTEPTAAAYNTTDNKIVITAATDNFDFSNISSGASDDIKNYLDWSKFSWILDEQSSLPTVVKFNDATGSDPTKPNTYIDTALITNSTTLEITLTSDGATFLTSKSSFGNLGGDGTFGNGTDGVRIDEGFIKDAKAGNIANLDGSSDGVDTTNDYVLFSNANAFSAENTNTVAVTYAGTNNAPTVQSFTLAAKTGTDGSDTTYITGETVTITATVDKAVTAGSTFTAQLDVTGTGAASSATDPTLTFTAAADGTTLTADHTVAAGERIDAVSILSNSFTVGTTTLDSQYTG